MYKSKDFSNLLGIEGLSDQLLQNHFKLYDGYVANTNKALELKKSLEMGTPEYNEVNRRFGWEFNGMRLHELFFGNIQKEGQPILDGCDLEKKLFQDFGAVQDWEKDFKAIASARGIGWVVLYYDPQGDTLVNVWINEHDLGHLTGGVPLLVIDVFEHAYITDYGLNKADYIDVFLQSIDWSEVSNRFERIT